MWRHKKGGAISATSNDFRKKLCSKTKQKTNGRTTRDQIAIRADEA